MCRIHILHLRVPNSRWAWLGQGTDEGLKPLDSLVTLKFERCCNADMSLTNFLRACPAVRNLSMKGSVLESDAWNFREPQHGTFSTTFWIQLKVLDISETGYFPDVVYQEVLKNIRDCSITHLYMERCLRIPLIIYDNLKIEFVSLAGLRDHENHRNARTAFDSIRNWAALPSLKEMNASGCQMSQAQREELVARHRNVIFNSLKSKSRRALNSDFLMELFICMKVFVSWNNVRISFFFIILSLNRFFLLFLWSTSVTFFLLCFLVLRRAQ